MLQHQCFESGIQAIWKKSTGRNQCKSCAAVPLEARIYSPTGFLEALSMQYMAACNAARADGTGQARRVLRENPTCMATHQMSCSDRCSPVSPSMAIVSYPARASWGRNLANWCQWPAAMRSLSSSFAGSCGSSAGLGAPMSMNPGGGLKLGGGGLTPAVSYFLTPGCCPGTSNLFFLSSC